MCGWQKAERFVFKKGASMFLSEFSLTLGELHNNQMTLSAQVQGVTAGLGVFHLSLSSGISIKYDN
jgi:hypothetical protein